MIFQFNDFHVIQKPLCVLWYISRIPLNDHLVGDHTNSLTITTMAAKEFDSALLDAAATTAMAVADLDSAARLE